MQFADTMLKNVACYAVIIGLFVGAVFFILHLGADLPPGSAMPVTRSEPSAVVAHPSPTAKSANSAFTPFLDHLRQPLPLLLMQLIVIVGATRLVGGLFRKIGQPSVIGEMVAGILLGPSLLGLVWPETQTYLFPPSSMPALRLLSQIGVILYMFLVGIDVDLARLRQKADAAVLVSHASIVVPFFLGTALCLFIYPAVAPSNVAFTPFALFMGIAMSITAFPVLARIIDERGLMGTYLGDTAIACAAVDDVTAWCLLALVVAVASASGLGGAALTIALTVCFIAVMLLIVRPQATRLVSSYRRELGSKGLVAGLLIYAFAPALLTEVIGIHALFGAFLAGAIMPANGHLRSYLRDNLEAFTTVLLLPLFFAFTGLRTQIGLLADPQGWLLCLVVIFVAVAESSAGARWQPAGRGLGGRTHWALGSS